MKEVKTSCLVENQITNNLYTTDEQFNELLKSIELDGILEPLIVRAIENISNNTQYEVISGNRRLRVARKLKIKKIPVIIRDLEKITEGLIVSHNQYREKKPSEILREILIINERYGLRQGVRTDKNPQAKRGKELKDQLINKHTKSKIDKLLRIDKLITTLSSEDSNIREKLLKHLDKKGSVHGTLKRLNKKVQEQENRKVVGEKYEVKREDTMIYQKSSENLSELKDNSVATIITSPPYFGIRNYNLGKNELGQENSVDDFINNLVDHFDDSRRVLKNNATMWVILGDYIQGYGYSAVPEKFLIKMLDRGWILHDKIIWIKNNPQFTTSNRSVQANEFIYIFKKNDFVYYDPTWVKNDQEGFGFISIGKSKLKSVFDFRDSIIITNSANNSKLRNECEEKGVHLTHNATFPISIPSIAIMTASKPGDLILDTFSGTATTGRSAKLLGRRYVGYELNPTYIKQSEIRLDMPLESDLDKAA